MAKPNDFGTLIDLTKTTQALISHFQSSLAPSTTAPAPPQGESSSASPVDVPNPLDAIRATTTLLRSHTTTLSLLLLTPPLTPSAIIKKIGDVSSGALSGMVAVAASAPQPGQRDELGTWMRAEVRARVRRVLVAWGDVLVLVRLFAERREVLQKNKHATSKGKDEGPTEDEKQDVLAATGVVWEASDALLQLCADGVVGLVVKKAEEWRATLMDAVEELKEWGEDVEDDNEDNSGEDDDGFADEDDLFGAENKLGKDDTELKALLDTSVKKLKKIGMLYQALIKRRLKTFPTSATATPTGTSNESSPNPIPTLDQLMTLLKAIPDTVDELASTFYDLDDEEVRQTLDKCCGEAKSAVGLVKQSWGGKDDEFTAWSGKWVDAFDAA
ncbi:hypothetical protein BDV95DRAFT_632043 [Massariosphaeria phaeospora]|uniref:Grap2 and cyclin-D-interacting-domain-containing protein n=1 Tax=Massariosphaeria phaeospora TaxID=100035 RepID=A0A7C8I1Y5_9PLEO|nr:hypothetical protein BDV95DRAFT_632043 [Massariosphaeria phaeospora]